MNKLDAYYETYTVNEDCEMLTFAKSKIPGFDPVRGFGYHQLTSESVDPQTTIILMNKVGIMHWLYSICLHYHRVYTCMDGFHPCRMVNSSQVQVHIIMQKMKQSGKSGNILLSKARPLKLNCQEMPSFCTVNIHSHNAKYTCE